MGATPPATVAGPATDPAVDPDSDPDRAVITRAMNDLRAAFDEALVALADTPIPVGVVGLLRDVQAQVADVAYLGGYVGDMTFPHLADATDEAWRFAVQAGEALGQATSDTTFDGATPAGSVLSELARRVDTAVGRINEAGAYTVTEGLDAVWHAQNALARLVRIAADAMPPDSQDPVATVLRTAARDAHTAARGFDRVHRTVRAWLQDDAADEPCPDD